MKHRKKTDDGLRFIGRHASVARRELEKKAETLYRGKVLIDRQRTRDITPIDLNNAKLKKHLEKLSQA